MLVSVRENAIVRRHWIFEASLEGMAHQKWCRKEWLDESFVNLEGATIVVRE